MTQRSEVNENFSIDAGQVKGLTPQVWRQLANWLSNYKPKSVERDPEVIGQIPLPTWVTQGYRSQFENMKTLGSAVLEE